MPYLIAAIDQIARELKRDVLLVRFDIPGFFPPDNFEQLESTKAFLKWASGEGIRAIPCGPPSNSGWVCGYFGDLYVDVISDDDNPDYQKLRAHLENEDGSMRQPGVTFWLMPLSVAETMAADDVAEDF